MIDYTKIKKRIAGDPDGQDVLRLRTGIVSSANADGTVGLTLSGVLVPNVPKLAGAVAVAGDTVQVASYRGSLLVLGRTAANASNPSYRVDQSVRTSNASNVTAEAVTDTVTVPLVNGRTYKVHGHGGLSFGTAGNTAIVRIRSGTTTGGTQLNYTQVHGVLTGNNWTFYTEYEFTAGSTGSQSFCLTMARNAGSAGTVTPAAAATSPTYLAVDYLRG